MSTVLSGLCSVMTCQDGVFSHNCNKDLFRPLKPFSTFETGTRISFFQSDSFGLVVCPHTERKKFSFPSQKLKMASLQGLDSKISNCENISENGGWWLLILD